MKIVFTFLTCVAVAAGTSSCGSNDSGHETTRTASPTTDLTPKEPLASELSFKVGASRAATNLNCRESRTLPAADGLGAMYMCISGTAQTVKFFINEEPTDGTVKTAKFLWNDWFVNSGDGIHADKQDALSMLDGVLAMYPTSNADPIKNAFLAQTDRTFIFGSVVAEYTFHHGPAIDARGIVFTPDVTIKRTKAIVGAAKGGFESCKTKVAGFTGYSEFTGDGEPVQNDGYISFMLNGNDKDMFFCEVHPDGSYKIKAALKGEFPFKYVAQGSF